MARLSDLGTPAQRIMRALKSDAGPRSPVVLRGLARNQAEFERAIGQLFLVGTVEWIGGKKGRRLSARRR